MAGIRSALALGVKIANKVTKPVQSWITYKRAVSDSSYSGYSYPTSVQLLAAVDWKQKQLRTEAGVLSVSRASVSFLDIDALKAATNGLGIDDHDIIILPDGTTGPILDMAGYIDPVTKLPFATEVFLG